MESGFLQCFPVTSPLSLGTPLSVLQSPRLFFFGKGRLVAVLHTKDSGSDPPTIIE
jgi:hypothetical protein